MLASPLAERDSVSFCFGFDSGADDGLKIWIDEGEDAVIDGLELRLDGGEGVAAFFGGAIDDEHGRVRILSLYRSRPSRAAVIHCI